MKICTTCKELKPLTEFFKSKTYKDGLGYRCKPCDTLARKKYRAQNLTSERISKKRAQLKFKYDLSYEDFLKLKEIQKDKCAICKIERELVVDHDHKTNIVRGLLCRQCNQALGLFYDDTITLSNAINYLSEIH